MASVNFVICNTFDKHLGNMSVDEDAVLEVPRMIDPSETKRAGDMIVGDYFIYGQTELYKITSIVA